MVVALSCGIGGVVSEKSVARRCLGSKLPVRKVGVNRVEFRSRRLRFGNVVRGCGLISDHEALDYDLGDSKLEERLVETRERVVNGSSEEAIESVGSLDDVRRPVSVQTELVLLALPAIAGQAIEPLAQLMETAYIGRLGALELASAGVSISIFNIVSKVFNIPLLSVATSFVAEDIAKHAQSESDLEERRQLPSVSTALVLSIGIGIIEAAALYFGAGTFLNLMGISSASSMRVPAQRFLQLRALGAPAVVLSLAIQGVFRGFKDTKTPVFCLGLGNLAAVFFFPILMYIFGLGVTGAAISTIASQYIVTFAMIWYLNKKTVLKLPKMKDLQFGGYLKSGGFLLGRTLAAVATVTLSTSMAARQGPIAMAAHQICLQVWLSSSLLADAQASAGQALIASSFSQRNYSRVKEITFYALKTGLITGVSLAIILGLSFSTLATLFTTDAEVLRIVRSGVLFVSASQPITALAYIYDGLHYGVSDFKFAACSMMLVGAMSSAFLLYAPAVFGLAGVWAGLTLFMGLRAVSGFIRLAEKNGPWWFLQEIPKTKFMSLIFVVGFARLLFHSKLDEGIAPPSGGCCLMQTKFTLGWPQQLLGKIVASSSPFSLDVPKG